ncbi:MAG TPA: LPS assembly protein LptD [Gammaproteobacteria bacterium]|nr:LPS assembly protein LptD [Gammaproteobacteria bacterium]
MALKCSRKSLWKLVIAAGLGATATAYAGGPPAICPLPSFKKLPPPAKSASDQTITIKADQATALRQGKSLFTGDVDVVQGDERLRADRMTYDSVKGSIFASGDVVLGTPTLEVKGTHGTYLLDTDLGTFFDAEFRLPERHGHGHAAKVVLTGPGTSELHDVSYTTCPPGRNDWALKTPDVVLNRNTDVGVAYNATIRFYGVPIFYTPFISFPLSDRRKSGFLSPIVGYSGPNGLDITAPYYFNIAPNFDATLSPRFLGRRGMLTTSQFRYLLDGTAGEMDFSILPHDRLAGRQRRRFHFYNGTSISDHWDFRASLNHVSDPNYFSDFGNSLNETAQVNQVSNVQVDYDAENWSFLTRLRSYQTLNAFGIRSRPPYRELPQMLLSWQAPPENYRLDYGFNSELVYFTYPGRIGAARLHAQPRIDYTFGSNAWYIRPAAKFDLAEYQLYNVDKPTQPTQLSRAAPIFSLDNGIVFERDAGFGGLIETLEPRLYYLYVPYRNQSAIPLFDTNGATFNYLQLFSDNRFNGVDRLGDANQLTYALTTRFVHPDTGRELLAASIGQIRYFRDRRVTLPNDDPETSPTSDIIGELRFNLNDVWSTTAALQWNPQTRHNDVASLQVQYHGGPYKIVNLGYRFRRARLEETDLSLAWPVSRHWRLVGRWNYSLKDQATRETFAGIEYENCCWAFVFVDRRYLRPTGDVASSLYFEIQFKGLGHLGRYIEEFLQRGILGYED